MKKIAALSGTWAIVSPGAVIKKKLGDGKKYDYFTVAAPWRCADIFDALFNEGVIQPPAGEATAADVLSAIECTFQPKDRHGTFMVIIFAVDRYFRSTTEGHMAFLAEGGQITRHRAFTSVAGVDPLDGGDRDLTMGQIVDNVIERLSPLYQFWEEGWE